MQDIILVSRTVETDIIDNEKFRSIYRPRSTLLTQKPIEEIIGEFSETGASHIREFHLRLFGGGVPRISLGNIGRNRACCLRHLIKLAAAGVVVAIKMAYTEVLRRQLNDIGKNPGV